MAGDVTRRRLLVAAAVGLAAAAAAPRAVLARRRPRAADLAPTLETVYVTTRGKPYRGDRPLLATVSPHVRGRDTAVVGFALDRPATVTLEAVRGDVRADAVVWRTESRLPAGRHRMTWRPAPTLQPGSYRLRLTVDAGGARRVYGGQRPATPEAGRAPVVRLLGIEAAFTERSYAPGQRMRLRVAADAGELTGQVYRSGPEEEYTDRADDMKGVAVGKPFQLDARRHRDAPWTVRLRAGDWATGLYFVKLTAEDGRAGFAPFIVRPSVYGRNRTAVVLPTYTWQAYNFHDADGDGWGDTWYAGGAPPVVLDRPYTLRGVPPRFRRYDLPFLRWLHRTHREPDVLADDDLGRFPTGDALRNTYDLVVFPGHEEYVTQHAYNVIERFRDLGGSLMFLSANNFFWRVDRDGTELRRVKLWRELGRPEAALLGAQYRANDDGSRQGVFHVVSEETAPWLWAGTGLRNGSTIGEYVGGYGIEIDGTAPSSPPGTQVLAIIPDLFGPGLSAEMTYYETPAGAKVFSAGVLDFAGSATFWPVRRMLDNLWARMTATPAPAETEPQPAAPEPPASA